MCKYLPYYCHRVSTQLQLTTISYHISHHIIISYHIVSYIISYHIIPYIISYHIISISNKINPSLSKPPHVFSQKMGFKGGDFVLNYINIICYTSMRIKIQHMQQYADIYSLQNYSTCFGYYSTHHQEY